ncbi:MAG: hypothetical protein LJE94_17810 [Deltaproteobacteria bacterium]|nr:hypothetical protein [Deltaproteobacteria bacterium]
MAKENLFVKGIHATICGMGRKGNFTAVIGKIQSIVILFSYFIAVHSVFLIGDEQTFAMALSTEDNIHLKLKAEEWEDVDRVNQDEFSIDHSYQTQEITPDSLSSQAVNFLMSPWQDFTVRMVPRDLDTDFFSKIAFGEKHEIEGTALPQFIVTVNSIADGLVGTTLILTIGIIFIDLKTFRITLKNCMRADKSISYKRTKNEAKRLLKHMIKIFILVIFFISIHLILIYPIDKYILPIDTAAKVISVFDIDPGTWKNNIKFIIYGSMNEDREAWHMARGYSHASEEFLQFIFWNFWYIAAALMLYLSLTFYFFVIKPSRRLHRNFKLRVHRRSIFYHKVDSVRRRKRYQRH